MGYLKTVSCNIDSLYANMARKRLSEAQRWRITAIHYTGMSFEAIGRQFRFHHKVISRLVWKHRETNDVKVKKRLGRFAATSQRENRTLICLVLLHPFATSFHLKSE